MSLWHLLSILFRLCLTFWLLPKIAGSWLLTGGYFLYNDISESGVQASGTYFVFLASSSIFALALFWQRQVTKIVRVPYLDEVFHIPQARAYCDGDFDVWDPKLTTPPGLYVSSTLFMKVWARMKCNVWNLRMFNTTVLAATMIYAFDCRSLIVRKWQGYPLFSGNQALKLPYPISPSTIHAAINIALFPPIFFFSGLYYTDVLSTCVVIRVYRQFLQRKGGTLNSTEGSLWIYLGGIVALTMRQTNIFWVAIFMGGLEAVRTIKMNAEPVEQSPKPQRIQDLTMSTFNQYIQGNIYDIPLKNAGVHDFALCAISIAIAIVHRPILILTRLWPYIALLISFAAFVVWNGGVVLGDKSNHVATIHLPQMLYIWPFIAFFSWPLLVLPALSFLQSTMETITYLLTPSPIPKFRTLRRLAFPAAYAAIALLAMLVIIRFNTIIHPFTLADNRHYIFYAFRYTILRHPLIRYLLAPIYIACFYLVYLSLTQSSKTGIFLTPNPDYHIRIRNDHWHGPDTSFFLIWVLSTALSLITAPLVEPRYFIIPWIMWRLHLPSPTSSIHETHISSPRPQFSPASTSPSAQKTPQTAQQKAAETRVTQIVDSQIQNAENILRTAGVKSPASPKNSADASTVPPSWPLTASERAAEKAARANGVPSTLLYSSEKVPGYGYALCIETLWFLLINAVTGYIFLYWGFEWESEPGNVQRFMW